MGAHVALWHDSDVSECPHHPTICYPDAGWVLKDRQKTTFQSEGREYPIELIAFEKNGVRVVSAHWFQAGDNLYTSADTLSERLALLRISGYRYDRLKVLLQSDRPSIEQARPDIEEFAALIIASFNEQHRANNINSRDDTEG
jgi:hypothetical protein